jgi:hypothetical protein
MLISTSPQITDPDTSTIRLVIEKMRAYKGLEDVPVLVMCDGVYDSLRYLNQATLESNTDPSEERLKERTQKYEEYKLSLLSWCEKNRVDTIVFTEHTHRANMTRKSLGMVKTPVVLPLDHDTYVQGDVPWDRMQRVMQNPEVNSVRFYYMEGIHEQHTHLVQYPIQMIEGVPLLKTKQYGDRPNLQKTDWLRWFIQTYIHPQSKMFIEEMAWPVIHNAGWEGWHQFKTWLYAPENMNCCVHLGTRGDLPMAIPVVAHG